MSLFRERKALLLLLQAVMVVMGAAALKHVESWMGDEVSKPWSGLGWAFIILSLAVIAFTLVRIYQEIEELKRQQPFGLEFYPCDTDEQAERAYKALRELFESLPDQPTTRVSVLNQFAETFETPGPKAEKARQDYLNAIVNKVNKITYHRMVQVRAEEIDGQWIERVARNYQEHFRRILEKRDTRTSVKTRHRTRLEIVPSVYPLSFMTITTGQGKSYLLWQIEEHLPYLGPDKSKYTVAGYLVLTDPQQIVIPHFDALFDRVKDEGNHKPVRMDDLNKLKAAS